MKIKIEMLNGFKTGVNNQSVATVAFGNAADNLLSFLYNFSFVIIYFFHSCLNFVAKVDSYLRNECKSSASNKKYLTARECKNT